MDHSKFPLLVDSTSIKNKKLIDEGIYFFNASLAGEAERYGRGKNTHTIHVWWARRPHRAMLPLTFASLAKTCSEEMIEIMKGLSFQEPDFGSIINDAHEAILDDYGYLPHMLDVFGGGGTIPQAGATLGLNTSSIDINPLSVFIQQCYLQFYPQLDFGQSEIIDIIQREGNDILNCLKSNTQKLYPARRDGNFVAYLWSYLVECESCSAKFLVSKRPWISKKLSNKPTRGYYLAFEFSSNSQDVVFKQVSKKQRKEYQRQYEDQSILSNQQCKKCGKNIDLDITSMEDRMLVKVKNNGYGGGKSFYLSEITDIDTGYMGAREAELLEKLEIDNQNDFPDIPKWSGITNPTLYGMGGYFDFLNQRQRVLMLELILLLKTKYEELKKNLNRDVANFVVGVLSSFIDQLVDWNCRLTIWISENLQPGRAFSGPGVPMYWDYCEVDPLLDGPANLWSKLDRVLDGLRSLPRFLKSVDVFHGSAQNLEFAESRFDAVVTDPPYYDNIYYSILADFIYVWKYQLFKDIMSELFSSNTSHRKQELVASTHRNGNDSRNAHDFYVNEMKAAINEIDRVLKDDGILTFIYSHSSLNGWIAIAQVFNQSNLLITSAQPITIERKARPRGHYSESVDSCVVLVVHKSQNIELSMQSFEGIKSNFRGIARQINDLLVDIGWEQKDIGQAIFASGVGLVSNLPLSLSYDQIYDCLLYIEKEVNHFVPSYRLNRRKSL